MAEGVNKRDYGQISVKFIDNIDNLLGDDLREELQNGGRFKIAAAHFSIFAYEALKTELEALESFHFIFNQPTFTVETATDRVRKEHREFFIPKDNRERSVFGDGFEIHLRNQLSQRAIARECADWIRRKGTFLSNRTESSMPEFGVVTRQRGMTAYRGIQKFDTVVLGYQPSDDLIVDIQKYDEPEHAKRYIDMFDRLWKNRDQMEDVTDRLVAHIESVYRENPPERMYFFILYTIFTEFLEDISEDYLPNDRTGEALMDSLDFDFFRLLDSVTIARSRKHIEQFYDMTEIGAFPTRLKPITHRLPISHRDDIVQLDDVVMFLSGLVLAAYTPLKYVYPSRLDRYAEQYDIEVRAGSHLKQTDREQSLVRLMTINLLKRLESSVHSFRLTVGKIHDLCAENLEAIRRFEGGESPVAALWSSEYQDLNEDDDFWDPDDISVGDKIKIDLKDVDLKAWKRDLEADHAALALMLEDMQKVRPDDDAKLQHLKTQMVTKVDAPINSANRKILVFTAFSDTAEYLYTNLAPVMKERGLETALVTGSANPKTTLSRSYDFQSVLTLFSPRSKEKELVMPTESAGIDVIFATDCISEGQNLQDCDYLVNYDIHWNPVRIIQRFGRIDRIGSTNEVIQLVNYWPDMDLDGYIRLKERVENRMAIVDLTATADDNILDPESPDLTYRKEQLRRMQEEVVDLEDVRTGVNITDLGLNDFRMDLLNFVRDHGTLNGLPTGLHAVLPAQPALGLVPSVVFALRNRNHGVNIMRLNRLRDLLVHLQALKTPQGGSTKWRTNRQCTARTSPGRT